MSIVRSPASNAIVRSPASTQPHTRHRAEPMSAVTRAASALTIRASAKPAKTTTATEAVRAKASSIPARAARFARDCTKPATLAVIANIVAASPAHAEAGKLFDFNLTLPLIATEFLILMTILDKTMFGPVGKALDDRDELIRSQLAAVGDNSAEVENLIAEKEKIIAAARQEVAAEVAALKSKMDADVAAAADKAKKEVDAQIAQAMAALDAAKKDTASQVDKQATAIADQIIAKVVSV